MARHEVLALAGGGGVILLALTLAFMHLAQPELDPVRHFVSEYAYGTYGEWLRVSYVVAGVGVFLLAMASLGWFWKSGWAIATSAALALVAIGLAGTGLTRIDLAGADGGTGLQHELSGDLAIVGLLVAGFVTGVALDRSGRPGPATASRRYAWLIVVGILAAVGLQRLDLSGIGQRFFLAIALSWLAWIALNVAGISSPRRTERQRT